MKSFRYTGKLETWHPDLGILKPGVCEGPDAIVDLLLAAGRASGDFVPVSDGERPVPPPTPIEEPPSDDPKPKKAGG